MRLDGGDARALREVERMTEEELRRAIAQYLPDPETFLALSVAQQDEALVQLTRSHGGKL